MDSLGMQHYASFVSAIVLFQLMPGPGTVVILDTAGRCGKRAGLAAVAGTLAGDFVYMLAAVTGLATLMQGGYALLRILQWIGAGYLCWTGLQQFLAGGRLFAGRQMKAGVSHAFSRALAVSLTNPKVVLFFFSFFPLFLLPGASGFTLMAMMAHVTIISFVYQAGLVLLGNMAASRLVFTPKVRGLARRIAGLALIGFGVRLAFASR
jgi:leucine efflux protein